VPNPWSARPSIHSLTRSTARSVARSLARSLARARARARSIARTWARTHFAPSEASCLLAMPPRGNLTSSPESFRFSNSSQREREGLASLPRDLQRSSRRRVMPMKKMPLETRRRLALLVDPETSRSQDSRSMLAILPGGEERGRRRAATGNEGDQKRPRRRPGVTKGWIWI